VKDCSPYRCQGGACTEPCSASSQCVSGFACDQGKCVKLGASSGAADDGGCGCRAGTRSTVNAWFMLGAIAALFAFGRRRARPRGRYQC
jgi:hypothetical protein